MILPNQELPQGLKRGIRCDHLLPWVLPGLAGSGVGDGKTAGGGGDDFEVCAICRGAFGIRNQGLGAIVSSVGAFRGVQHVKVFDAGAVMHGLPCFGHSGLVRTVVHDGDDRMNGIDQGARIGEIHTVMVDHVKIDGRYGVVGTDKRNLFGACEVAKIEEPELSEGDEDAAGSGILGWVVRPLALGGTVWIRRRLDAWNCGDVLAVGSEHDDVEAREQNGVAGMHNAARPSLNCLQIRCKVATRDVGVLAVGAVIEELADRDALDQLRHASYMVDVEVSNEDVVETRDARIFHRRLYTFHVTAVVVWPTGVDKERSSGRSNKQCGLAALDVNRIDQQALWSVGLCGGGRGPVGEEQRQSTEGERERWKAASDPRVQQTARKVKTVLNGYSHSEKYNWLRVNLGIRLRED